MASIHVSLSEEMRAWVDGVVAGGEYHNSSEFIRDLIRRDREQRQREGLESHLFDGLAKGERPDDVPVEMWNKAMARLRERVDVGLDQMARGEGSEWSSETADELLANIRERGSRALAREGSGR